jgi:uncharacterized membrane protein YfbV (UPF0208 family)
MRTAAQISADFYKVLKGSSLAGQLNGGVYYEGLRPVNSTLEDATIVFTQGIAGQIDSGTITVLVFVPDIDHDGTGALVENKRRTAEIESAALQWVKELQEQLTAYNIELAQVISTTADETISQHFVSIKIDFQSFDN